MGFDFAKVTNNNTGVAAAAPTKAIEKEIAPVTPVATTVLERKVASAKAPIMGLDATHLGLSSVQVDKLVSDTVNNLNLIEDELNVEFVERENEIHMLALSVVAGVNAFYHGPAGTGKSALVEEFSQRIIDSNYFRILMGKTTEPGEVFGPVSINAMKNDSYKVATAGKLPESHFAFVDEIFKANSAVLNSLLTIMNEKIFFNDGVQPVPLISMIGASNEYMEED